jgi:D-lactate dehydrogenase (cytochrome)
MPAHTARARPSAARPRTAEIDRSAERIAAYLEDAAHFPGGRADGIARPRDEAEVAGLVRTASRVLPVGAQSSVTGGATPGGGLVLSTERLETIHEAGQDRFRVGAGVPLDTLQKLLRERGRWYAPFPTFTGAFMGGVTATNAAGAATFKYGTTRDWVDGLSVVLACGCVLRLERGAVTVHPRDGVALECACGRRRVPAATYRMPGVPKCSAGYFSAPGMDFLDLFVGSEGTLGVIIDVTVRTLPVVPATAIAAVFATSEAAAIELVRDLRDVSLATWRTKDPRGIDVAAVEHLDRRALELLRADGVDRRLGVRVPDDTALLLLVQLELPAGTTAARAFEQAATALDAGAPDTTLTRFSQVLDARGWLDRTELVPPGSERRAAQLLALREAAPMAVNARVGRAKREIDARIEKTAADMIVPFDRVAEMMAVYRDGFERRGLEYAIWGHLSDGNVHPNLIPSSWDDVVAAREAILEFGLEAARLGGSPLAEHGVGRSATKQALLRQLYGDAAIEEMRAIKRALDPDGKLAPGVILGAGG